MGFGLAIAVARGRITEAGRQALSFDRAQAAHHVEQAQAIFEEAGCKSLLARVEQFRLKAAGGARL